MVLALQRAQAVSPQACAAATLVVTIFRGVDSTARRKATRIGRVGCARYSRIHVLIEDFPAANGRSGEGPAEAFAGAPL
jgi:hypothetical protein